MGKRSGAVLALTDLTRTSDAVLLAAAELAQSHGGQLYVLHALDLRNKPLREALIALDQVKERVAAARRAVAAQLERLLPEELRLNAPIVEIDSAEEAMRHCIRQISPSFVVHSYGGEIVVRDQRDLVPPIPA